MSLLEGLLEGLPKGRQEVHEYEGHPMQRTALMSGPLELGAQWIG